jgi:hypothetical protein
MSDINEKCSQKVKNKKTIPTLKIRILNVTYVASDFKACNEQKFVKLEFKLLLSKIVSPIYS